MTRSGVLGDRFRLQRLASGKTVVEFVPEFHCGFTVLPTQKHVTSVPLCVEVHESPIETLEHATHRRQFFHVTVDPVGHVYEETPLFSAEVRTATVFTSDTITLYTRWGDVVGGGAALGAVLLLVLAWKRGFEPDAPPSG